MVCVSLRKKLSPERERERKVLMGCLSQVFRASRGGKGSVEVLKEDARIEKRASLSLLLKRADIVGGKE